MKTTLKALLAAALLAASASAFAGSFVIKANVKGQKWEGKKVILCTGRGAQEYHPIDSAVISKGLVTFKGKAAGPQLLTLRFYEDDNREQFTSEGAIKKDGLMKMHHVLRGLKYNRETGETDKTNDLDEFYGIHEIPSKFLIDPDGNIVGKFESDKLDKKLTEIYQ